ncbi:MAG: hypothetical protein R3A79_21885 [Nannocystaceae bacterium]
MLISALILPLACGDDGTSSGSETASSTTGDTTTATSTTGTSDTTTTTTSATTGGMSDSDTGTTTTTGETTGTTTTGETTTTTTGSTTEDPTTSTGTGTTGDTDTLGTTGDSDTDTDGTTTTGGDENPLWNTPNLWYSVEDKLHYIAIDDSDGSVVDLVTSTIATPLLDGFTGITMLEDGSLLGSRVLEGMGTQIFYVADPPTEPSTIDVQILGMVPDALLIEALYTDCKGLVYLMDSGADLTTSTGNRLIRFTGDYLGGDLSYEVITDLENASVADIDDLGPGIDPQGEITDGEGFAIDSGTVYLFNYNDGTGSQLGKGGTWGSHALGGPLFTDGTARLYLLDINANLVEAHPQTLALSGTLVTGPKPAGDAPAGWSGLTGPLTECQSTLPQ